MLTGVILWLGTLLIREELQGGCTSLHPCVCIGLKDSLPGVTTESTDPLMQLLRTLYNEKEKKIKKYLRAG